jgi:sec-independent protein translocase protein TatC
MFVTSAYMCLLAAVILTIPVTFYQAWEFVAPGLKRKERKAVVPILSIGSILFVLGAFFAYMVVVPVALQFLMGYTQGFTGVRLLWNIGDTLKFESVLMLVFGFAFEMPLVVVALTRVGVLSPDMLARRRRHCIVGMFIAGALLTPPDVVTQICLAVPLVVLFEISILASKFFKPKHTIWEGWEPGDYDDTLGKEWDREAAARAPAAETTDGTYADQQAEDYGEDAGEYDDYSEGEYYDDYDAEGHDEDLEDDGMGDDIDWHDEDEIVDESVDEGPPEEEQQDGGEASDEGREPDDDPSSDRQQG